MDELVRRCLDMAKSEGIIPEQIHAEGGDYRVLVGAAHDGKNEDEAARVQAADAAADRKAGKG